MGNQEIQPRISQKMNTGMKKGGVIKGFVPETFEDIQRCAALAVNAGRFHVLNDDKTLNETASIANATLAVMQGMEVGMPVVMSIQLIAVINGRCVIHSEAVPALIWRAGHTLKEWMEGEGDTRVAYCEVTRGDSGEIIKRSFSVKDAKTANLWDPNDKNQWGKTNKSTWHCYPERMLQMRARGFCARDGVPDVLTGLYIREEMEDVIGLNRDDDAPASREAVVLPSVDLKQDAPSGTLPQIEDHTAENEAAEVRLPAPDLCEVPEMMTQVEQKREAVSAADIARSAEFIAKVDPAAEKRPRGRPRKEALASPEDVVRIFKLKFANATSTDDLDEIFKEADEASKKFSDELRDELNAAYNLKYDAFEEVDALA